jgi:hypothetical protein
MAATGYTPIQLYYSTTAAAVPVNTNLANGELAINITDGKLYYKNNSGVVTLLSTAGQWISTGSDIYYSTGNVGIGTSSPASALDVKAANAGQGIRLTSTTGTNGVSYKASNSAGNLYFGIDTSAGGSFGTANAGLIWYDAAQPLIFGTNNVKQATLDSAGNLGLGVTPSAWRTDFNARSLQLNNASFSTFNDDSLYVAQNGYLSSTGWKYTSTRAATLYTQNAGVHAWSTAASGTAGNAISFTQVLGINASGALGVGSSPSYGTAGQVLTSGGSGAAPTWATSASSQWTTSGSDIYYNTGNVAVGSAPQTYSLGKALEVGFAGNGINGASQTQVTFIGNAYYNSGWKYGGTGKAAFMQLDAGNIIWYNTDTSGTAGASISTFAERMRIDTAGRVFVGTLRPTTDAQFSSYTSNGNSNSIVVGVRGQIGSEVYPGLNNVAGGYFIANGFGPRYGVRAATSSGYDGSYAGYFIHGGNATSDGYGVYAEALQEDTNGSAICYALYGFGKSTIGVANNGFAVGVFARTNDYVNNINIIASSDYTGGSTQTVMRVRRNGSNIGSITTTTTATAYNTSSDHRLKNSIVPMTGALAKVAQLKPVTYKWNSNGEDGEGFIAHELAEVVPCAVTGVKDEINVEQYVIEEEQFNVNITPAELDADGNEITPAKNEKIVIKPAVMGSREVPVYQSIDTSFLVATLTAAIQEQQAIIESLKARLDAANL